jgi:hypothetical protein
MQQVFGTEEELKEQFELIHFVVLRPTCNSRATPLRGYTHTSKHTNTRSLTYMQTRTCTHKRTRARSRAHQLEANQRRPTRGRGWRRDAAAWPGIPFHPRLRRLGRVADLGAPPHQANPRRTWPHRCNSRPFVTATSLQLAPFRHPPPPPFLWHPNGAHDTTGTVRRPCAAVRPRGRRTEVGSSWNAPGVVYAYSQGSCGHAATLCTRAEYVNVCVCVCVCVRMLRSAYACRSLRRGSRSTPGFPSRRSTCTGAYQLAPCEYSVPPQRTSRRVRAQARIAARARAN